MAIVATIPPTAVFGSVSPVEQTLSKPILAVRPSSTWREVTISQSPAWLRSAIVDISALVADGRAVPGFGDFRPTPEAARVLRLELNAIALEFLPKPTVYPISGGGLMARWSRNNRSVEITVYHDGEVVRDAMESATTNETISELTASSMLSWMSGQSVLVNAHV